MSGRAVSLETRVSLNREEAAAAVGVSPAVFDRMVAAGELPKPMRSQVARRLFWSVDALRAAMIGARPPAQLATVDAPEPEDAYEGVRL